MLSRLDDLSISTKGFILAAVPTLFAFIVFVILFFMLHESNEAANREKLSKDVLFSVQRMGPIAAEALSVISTYSMVRKKSLLTKYGTLVKRREKEKAHLEKLLKRDPKLMELGRQWYESSNRLFLFVEAEKDSLTSHGDDYTSDDRLGLLGINGFRRQMQFLIPHECAMRHAFVKTLSVRQKENAKSVIRLNDMFIQIIPVALLINFALSIALSVYYSSSINRRLSTMIDNSQRLAAGQELNPLQGGRDEIGRLDKVFHRMARELETVTLQEKAIIEKAVDVICSLSEEAKFDSINKAAEEGWGYRGEDLKGKELFEFLHADDKAAVRAQLELIAASKSEGHFECRLISQDGKIMHVSWSVNWLDEERLFYCVAHDITQRKLEEALLKEREQMTRLVLESMPLGLLVSDEEQRIEITNLSTKQMLGYKDAEIIDQSVDLILANKHGQQEAQFLNRMYDTADGAKCELMVRRKDGEDFPAELTVSEFELNEERKVLLVVQDITLRREVERVKKEFVAMVSHDLRTPLTTILGSLQLLQAGPLGTLNQGGRDRVDTAYGETERLIALVNTLLDLEKFEAGQMEIHRESVDVSSLVSHSVNALSPLAQKNSIELVKNVEPVEAKVDQNSITQVLINLISNAIKFSPPGSAITVSALKLNDAFEIRITDKGRGIPDSHKETIFERFKQVEATDRTEKKGSGLGLAICKLIVETHGGVIGVDSKLGEGSSFWFRIPSL